MRGKIQGCPLVTTAREAKPGELVQKIYLTVLSRPPTAKELATIEDHVTATHAGARETAEDLVWALINQPEFIYIH